MFLKEKTIHYTWLVALVSGTSLLLNFYLIPRYSYLGAAISNMTASLIYLIIAYNLSQRFFYVQRKVFNVSFYILIVFFISVSFPVLQLLYNIDISIYLKLFMMLVSLLLPFLFGLIDIKSFRNLLK